MNAHTSSGHSAVSADIVRAGASRCVACGMCLPHCPTYRKTRSELESPRGRLSLMLALARGELEPSARLEAHLSLCLLCRACESVCPAGVPFGATMDAARAQLSAGRRPSWRRRAGLSAVALLARPRWAALAARLLRFYRMSGTQGALRRTGLLRVFGLADADAELPPLAAHVPLASFYPAAIARRGAVALFAGCVARVTDAETLHSAVRVLTHLGYDVHVPPGQACCGALHRHGGDTAGADRLLHDNLLAFADSTYDAIVTTASGCAAELTAHEKLGGRVADVSSFVANLDWPAAVTVQPLPKRIAVQDPCTLVNVLRARRAPYALLQKIPQAQIVPLPGNNQCCGAAGAYHLEHGDMAHRLRDDKMTELSRLAPDVLATSNVGCAMHIGAGARAAGLSTEIVHPITLLARQIGKL